MADNRPPGPKWLDAAKWELIRKVYYAVKDGAWKYPAFKAAVDAVGKNPTQAQRVKLHELAYETLDLYDNPHERAHDRPYR